MPAVENKTEILIFLILHRDLGQIFNRTNEMDSGYKCVLVAHLIICKFADCLLCRSRHKCVFLCTTCSPS